MVPRSEPTKRVLSNRERWLAEAWEVLRTEGIDAVNVVNLAKRLGTSRGPFYYAFRDLGELHEALFQLYLDRLTTRFRAAVASFEGSHVERHRYLFQRMVDEKAPAYDFAVRSWAMRTPEIAPRLLRMDEERIGYLQILFSDMGFDAFEARVRAEMNYNEYVGLVVSGKLVDSFDNTKPAFLLRTKILLNPLVR